MAVKMRLDAIADVPIKRVKAQFPRPFKGCARKWDSSMGQVFLRWNQIARFAIDGSYLSNARGLPQ